MIKLENVANVIYLTARATNVLTAARSCLCPVDVTSQTISATCQAQGKDPCKYWPYFYGNI